MKSVVSYWWMNNPIFRTRFVSFNQRQRQRHPLDRNHHYVSQLQHDRRLIIIFNIIIMYIII